MNEKFLPTCCYHTHTKRCGHAYGEDEEYVLAAVENGYQELGFTDHAMLPNIEQRGTRGSYSLLDDYVTSILSLRKKYQDQIHIYLGFEAEYDPSFAEYYRFLFQEKHFDYLILGQHYFRDEKHLCYYGNLPTKGEATRRYVMDCVHALESGLYSYFAHPDLFMCWEEEWSSRCEEAAVTLLSKAKELGIPVEINMGRSRLGGWSPEKDLSQVSYPNQKFWEIAGKMGMSAFIGPDAHSPKDLYYGPFSYMKKIADENNVPIETRLKLPR